MNRDSLSVNQIERQLGLTGKRVCDVPELAWFRRKYRWRFYRLADGGMFLTIFGVILSVAPSNPLWWLSLLTLPLTCWVVFFAESHARILSRQLNRRAAEQLWRDMTNETAEQFWD